jgi:hypothetical protein
MSKAAKSEDKTVFDKGAFSDPAAGLNKDGSLHPATPEAHFETDWIRHRSAESTPRRGIEGFESKRASGFAKVDGRHIAADGLVSRRGYRRIISDSSLDREWFDLDGRVEELAKIAKEVLHGRNATVFEGRVLNPLMGQPKLSIEELAAQFGTTAKRIYNIVDDCRDRIIGEFRRRTTTKANGDKFPTCGRVYAEWNFGQCARNNGSLRDGYLHGMWT